MWNKSSLLWLALCSVVVLLACCDGPLRKPILSVVESGSPHEEDSTAPDLTTSNAKDTSSESIPRRSLSIKSIYQMVTDFNFAKARLYERLKVDYGPEIFETVFMDDDCKGNQTRCTIGRKTFMEGSSNSMVSWEKTVRKMKLNILEYLRSGKVQDFVWATAYVPEKWKDRRLLRVSLLCLFADFMNLLTNVSCFCSCLCSVASHLLGHSFSRSNRLAVAIPTQLGMEIFSTNNTP